MERQTGQWHSSTKRKSSRQSNQPRKRRSKDKIECPVCLEYVRRERMTQVDTCGCRYCGSCIKHTFMAALDKTSFPARCCGRMLDVDVFQNTLPARIVRKYRKMVDEHSDSSPLYCAASTCREFISSTVLRGKFGSCASCHTQTCRECNKLKADHIGCYSICAAGEAELDELAREEGWKRCPKCAVMIEKLSGCNDVRYEW